MWQFVLIVGSFKCTSVNPKTEKCLSPRTGIDYKIYRNGTLSSHK